MKIYAPDYYKDFKCIASRCQHNCCIGWEIDIDEKTLAKYRAEGGALGEKLKENIEEEGEIAHFRLKENERCPFLNDKGLCDIITELGEDALCEICAMHPRYQNFFSDRKELGLGISCEEACRLLLRKKTPFSLVLLEETDEREEPLDDTEKALLEVRDTLLCIAQNRDKPLSCRMQRILAACDASLPERSYAEWADFYRTLERLDGAWDERLRLLSSAKEAPDGFAETECEQLLCYFIARHLPSAFDAEDIAACASFAVHAVKVIRALAYADEAFGLEQTARMYSAEIEYSEENTLSVMNDIFFSE